MVTTQEKKILVKSKPYEEDILIIAKVIAGDKNAYEAIFMKYHKTMFVKLLSYSNGDKDLAMDLLMETFTKAFENLSHYKYTEGSKFIEWLYSVMHNNAIDYFRKQNSAKRGSGKVYGLSQSLYHNVEVKNDDYELKEVCESPYKNPEEEMILKEHKKLLNYALGKLSANAQHIVMMRYFDNKSYEEISVELNIGLNNVKSILKRAKKRIGSILEPLMGEKMSNTIYIHAH